MKNKGNDTRKRYGIISSVVGIAVNILIASLKLIVGIFSSSIAIIADALNNFSDAGSSVVTFVSFKLASKPADKDHPFGHARIEYVCSMAVAFLIMVVGFELFTSSFGGLITGDIEQKSFSTLTFIILSISILMKLWLATFNFTIARKINSTVVKATATDALTDAISTSAILICGIIIKYTNFIILDSIVGIVISVMIIIAGIKILNETKNSILGEAPVDELVESIKRIVGEFEDIIGIHDMMVHNYGPDRFFASLHAEVDGEKNIFLLHDMIDLAERRLNEELGIPCTIHMDPIETNNETVTKLRAFTEETVKEIDNTLSIHDFRTVVGVTHTNLIFDVAVPFDYKSDIKDVEYEIKRAISAKREDCFCVITIDRC
jgi:cation diffusion facilitator family transporter